MCVCVCVCVYEYHSHGYLSSLTCIRALSSVLFDVFYILYPTVTYTVFRFGAPYTGYVLYEQYEPHYLSSSSLRLAENSSEVGST